MLTASSEYSSKNNEYFSAARSDMLEFIPTNITKVLEIGCGDGLLGELLAKRNGASVTGVELNPEAAKRAEARLSKVLSGDFFAVEALLPNNHYECVVLNDVLEHVYNPEALLKSLQNKLVDNGLVIASIPNVRYFRVLSQLFFNKDWQYEDSGVLDYTHLRFFTQKSILRMFSACELKVSKCIPISKTKSLRPILYHCLTFGLLGMDTQFKQIAIVARKI